MNKLVPQRLTGIHNYCRIQFLAESPNSWDRFQVGWPSLLSKRLALISFVWLDLDHSSMSWRQVLQINLCTDLFIMTWPVLEIIDHTSYVYNMIHSIFMIFWRENRYRLLIYDVSTLRDRSLILCVLLINNLLHDYTIPPPSWNAEGEYCPTKKCDHYKYCFSFFCFFFIIK